MNRKDEFDKLMYLLGEENSIEQLNHPMINHKFSEKYERRKLNMINEYNGQESNISENVFIEKKKKGKRKKSIILVAAIVAALGISLTVYASTKIYAFVMNKNEDTGDLDYKIESQVTKVPKIEVKAGYIPQGYVESENSPGKYHLLGDESAGKISIGAVYGENLTSERFISNVKETTIGGIKAHILTREGSESNHVITLFYEEDGQTIKIHGTKSIELDELIKVAENITYKEIPGEFVNLEDYQKASEGVGGYLEDKLELKKDKLFSIGEGKTDIMFPDSKPTYRVDSIEVLDNLPELNPEGFVYYEEYLASINGDGTLKEYERTNNTNWENNKLNSETELIGRKFVLVQVTMTNPLDSEMKDIFISPQIQYLKMGDNNTMELLEDYWGGTTLLQVDNAPMYFDQSSYEGKHFFFSDFAANETKEVQLIYVIDEDYLDDAYVGFNLAGGSMDSIAVRTRFIKVTN